MPDSRTQVPKMRRHIDESGFLEGEGGRTIQFAATLSRIHTVQPRLRVDRGRSLPVSACNNQTVLSDQRECL